jgi:hypothetical protein
MVIDEVSEKMEDTERRPDDQQQEQKKEDEEMAVQDDAISVDDIALEEKPDLEDIISFVHNDIVHQQLLGKVFKLISEKNALVVKR